MDAEQQATESDWESVSSKQTSRSDSSASSDRSLTALGQVLTKTLCEYKDFKKAMDFYMYLPLPRRVKALIMLKLTEKELVQSHGKGQQYMLDLLQDLEAMHTSFKQANGFDFDTLFELPKVAIPNARNIVEFRDLVMALEKSGNRLPVLPLVKMIESSLPSHSKSAAYYLLQRAATENNDQGVLLQIATVSGLTTNSLALLLSNHEDGHSDGLSTVDDDGDHWSLVSGSNLRETLASVASSFENQFEQLGIHDQDSVSSTEDGFEVLETNDELSGAEGRMAEDQVQNKDQDAKEPNKHEYAEEDEEDSYMYEDDEGDTEFRDERPDWSELLSEEAELSQTATATLPVMEKGKISQLTFDTALPEKVTTINDLREVIKHFNKFSDPFDYNILVQILENELPADLRKEGEEVIQREYVEPRFFGAYYSAPPAGEDVFANSAPPSPGGEMFSRELWSQPVKINGPGVDLDNLEYRPVTVATSENRALGESNFDAENVTGSSLRQRRPFLQGATKMEWLPAEEDEDEDDDVNLKYFSTHSQPMPPLDAPKLRALAELHAVSNQQTKRYSTVTVVQLDEVYATNTISDEPSNKVDTE